MTTHSTQGSVVIHRIRTGKDGRDSVFTYLTVSPLDFGLDAEGKIKGSKVVTISAWKRVAGGAPAKVADNDTYITVTAYQKNGTENKGYKTTQKADLTFNASEDFVTYVVDLYDGIAKSNLLDSKTIRIGAKDAIDSVRVDLDNENDTMLYDGAGNKLSDDVVSHITLYDGVTQHTGSPATFVVPVGGWKNCEGELKGNTITVTKLTGETASVTIHATYKDKVYPAILSLKKLVGVDKYDIVVSPNAVGYNTTKKSVQSGASLTVQVYRTPANGGTRHVVSKLADYALALSCSIANILGAYASGKATVTVSATTANDNQNIVLTLTKDGVSQDSETIPITKATDGENSVRVDLDNENDTMLYSSAKGLVSGEVKSKAYMYDGSQDVSDKATWAVEGSGCTVSSGNSRDIVVTGMSDMTATVTVKGTYTDNYGAKFEKTAILTLKKIVDGDKYDLVITPNAISYNSTNDDPAETTLTIQVWRMACDGKREKVAPPTGYATYILDGSTQLTYNAAAEFTYKCDNSARKDLTVKIAKGYTSTEYLDCETIPVNKSKDGKSPFLLDLTNENTVVNCDYEGNPLSGAKYETSKVQLQYGPEDAFSWFTISVTKDGITDGWNANTRMLNPSAITKDVATITVTATGKSGTKAEGTTLSAVMTISKNKPGRPGESPVMYSLISSHGTVRKDRDTNAFIDDKITFKVLKIVGTAETMLDTYKKLSDAGVNIICDGFTYPVNYNKTTTDAVTADVATYFNADHKEFSVWVNGQEYDREGIDCVYDGKTGGEGPGGFSYMLSVNNASIQFGSDGKVSSDSFYGYAYKLTADGGQTAVNLTETGNKVRVYYNAGNVKDLTGYSYGYFSGSNVLQGLTLTRSSVVIQLLVNNKVVASNTVLVMLPGADGYQYLPINNGLYSSEKEYVWNAERRDFIDYQFEGVWMRFGVAEYGKTVKGAVPTTVDKAGDGNWKVVEQTITTLLVNTAFATNANLGGFLASSQRFLSTQIAYFIRYLGAYNQNTAYEYVEPNNYNALLAARLDMVLYNSEYWVPKYIIQYAYRYKGTFSQYATYEYVTPSATNGLSVSRIDIVQYNSKYWILKSVGSCSGQTPSATSNYWRETTAEERYALEAPSLTSNFWRLATSEEKKCAENGVNTITEMRKLELNGENGIIKLLHSNGYKWEVTNDGIQVLGVDSGRHLEIDPNEREFRIYNDDGTLVVKFDGETIAAMDDIFSGKTSPTITLTQASYSNQSQGKGYIGNASGQADKTEDTQISSAFVTTSPGKITIKGTLGARSNEKYLGEAQNIDSSQIHTSTDVPVYRNGYWYMRNEANVYYIIKSLSGGKWTITYVSGVTSDGSGSWVNQNVSREVVLPAGTHYIYIRANYHLQEGTSNYGYVRWSNTTVSFVYDFYQSRIFANGLVFGSSKENFFSVIRESDGNMAMRMLTNSMKYGLEIFDNMMSDIVNKHRFRKMITLAFGYVTCAKDGSTYTDTVNCTYTDRDHNYSDPLKCSRTAEGVHRLIFPAEWSGLSSNFFVTAQGYNNTTNNGKSTNNVNTTVTIKSISTTDCYVVVGDDMSPNDLFGFYFKIECMLQ